MTDLFQHVDRPHWRHRCFELKVLSPTLSNAVQLLEHGLYNVLFLGLMDGISPQVIISVIQYLNIQLQLYNVTSEYDSNAFRGVITVLCRYRMSLVILTLALLKSRASMRMGGTTTTQLAAGDGREGWDEGDATGETSVRRR